MITDSLFLNLSSLLPSSELNRLLPVIGGRLLTLSPMESAFFIGEEDDLSGEIQSDWIDQQLYETLPFQNDLENLMDARFTTLQSAWPDGFHEVVFDDGRSDKKHSQSLVDEYLEYAYENDIPLMTDFGSTVEEMEEHLREAFGVMMKEWRVNLLGKFKSNAKVE